MGSDVEAKSVFERAREVVAGVFGGVRAYLTK
jgi:hypothetical protein